MCTRTWRHNTIAYTKVRKCSAKRLVFLSVFTENLLFSCFCCVKTWFSIFSATFCVVFHPVYCNSSIICAGENNRLAAWRSTRSAKASGRVGSASLWCPGASEPAPPCSPRRFGQSRHHLIAVVLSIIWVVKVVMLPPAGSVWPCGRLRQPGFRNGRGQEPGPAGCRGLRPKELRRARWCHQVRRSTHSNFWSAGYCSFCLFVFFFIQFTWSVCGCRQQDGLWRASGRRHHRPGPGGASSHSADGLLLGPGNNTHQLLHTMQLHFSPSFSTAALPLKTFVLFESH